VSLGEVAAIRDAGEQKAYERLLNPGLLQLWSGVAAPVSPAPTQCTDVDIHDDY